MTNKEIRRRAWELCKMHFWKLLGVTLFISLITSLLTAPFMGSVMQSAATGQIGISPVSIVSLVLLLLVATVLEAGLLQYLSNLWNGRPAGIATLFVHARRIFRLLGIGLLTILCMYVFAISMSILAVLLGSISEILVFVTMLVMVFFVFYAEMRITPAMTAFVLSPDLTAWQCIKTAWRATKGRVRRMLANAIMLALPMLAANLIIMVLTPVTGVYANPLANIIVKVVTVLISALFSIYMQFGQYGLFELLLTNKTASSGAPVAELWESTPVLPACEDEYDDEYEDIPEDDSNADDTDDTDPDNR